MASLNSQLTVIAAGHKHEMSDTSYWVEGECSHCGRASFLVIAATTDGHYTPDNSIVWLRCLTCRRGVVANHGVVSPGASSLPAVAGAPEDVERVWDEVRACLGVSGYTAAVMLCRKILFHLAVEAGLPAKDGKDRAPTFAAVLRHLEVEGLVTPKMRGWVEHIKDVGNEANHELDAISADKAGHVATFTHQLLVLTYEMPARMASALGPLAVEPPAAGEQAVDL